MTSPIFTTEKLSYYRQFIIDRMDKLATLNRVTIVDDGHGGQIENTTTITNLKCLLGLFGTGREEVVAAKIQSVTPYYITFGYGTEIKARDRITIAPYTYEVQGVIDETSYSIAVVAICTRMD